MTLEIVDVVDVGIPGPAGTITPAAQAALAQVGELRNQTAADAGRAESAREGAEAAYDEMGQVTSEGVATTLTGPGPARDALAGEIAGRAAQRRHVPLIVFLGESNSGGQALNSQLTEAERAPRSAVQILNNTTLQFEDLHIGVNNQIGHTEWSEVMKTTFHGWEAGLATSAEAGEWKGQVYLVKSGQGGSRFDQWQPGSAYMQVLGTRVASAAAAIRTAGFEPDIYLWASIGINDSYAGMTAADYGIKLRQWVANVRAIVGLAPMLFTTLMSPQQDSFNVVLDAVNAEDPFFWLIETRQADKKDASHWSMTGMKRIARGMIDRSLRTIGQGLSYDASRAEAAISPFFRQAQLDQFVGVTWTSPGGSATVGADGTMNTNGSSGTGALGPSVDATKPFEFEVYYPASSQGIVTLLHESNAPAYGFASLGNFPIGVYHVDGTVKACISPSGIETNQPINPLPTRVRFRKSGNDIIFSISRDGGLSFSDFYTQPGVLAGKTTLYLKASAALSNASSVRVSRRVLT